MRAIDTNVLVRLIVQDDEKQAANAKAFVAFGAWVSKVVLVESIWVLTSVYRLTHLELADTIEMLLSHGHIVIEDAESVAAALARYRERPSLRFSDCVILESACKAGHMPLGTFDKNLAKIAGTHKL